MFQKALLFVVVGALAWWGGAAFATHSDPAVVHLCAQPNGKVKVVQNPASCTGPNTVVEVASSAALAALDSRVAALEALLDGVSRDPGGNLTFPASLSAGPDSDVTAENVHAVLNVTAGLNVAAPNVSADIMAASTGIFTNMDVINNLRVDGDLEVVGKVANPESSTVLVEGNLQVVNGTGTTGGAPNGLGNIIIGYNTDNSDNKAGSHYLVVGDDHTFTRHSGIVAGSDNEASGAQSFVGGGFRNIASGQNSFVGGGSNNEASGFGSFVTGSENIASGLHSFVGGGAGSNASGSSSFIGGGISNDASSSSSFIGGGIGNDASGTDSFVGGGSHNEASGLGSFVSGRENEASGAHSFAGGGSFNIASGFGSFVGGSFNSDASGADSFVGGGGISNASGTNSFIGGGSTNDASGFGSFVGGGSFNTAGPGTCAILVGTVVAGVC